MRKLALILPVCAILCAAAVLLSELGASAAAQTPDAVVNESTAATTAVDGDDPSAANWVETAIPDTRKPRLPPPKKHKKKK